MSTLFEFQTSNSRLKNKFMAKKGRNVAMRNKRNNCVIIAEGKKELKLKKGRKDAALKNAY